VARGTEFTQDDLGALDQLFEKLTGTPGRFERMTKAHRWVSAKPAAGEPDVTVDVGAEERVLNLIVTTTGFEPGKALIPMLGERGVTTPTGWQLMADVGWVIGWRAPRDVEPQRVLSFGFDVVKGLGLEPADRRWRARFETRPPRPGWQTGRKD
jgi:hypothetical protein